MDRRLVVLALGMFALGTDSFVVAGILPEIARTFQVSIGAAGQMTTVYAVTFAIMGPSLAALMAHIPRKPLLLAGLIVFVVANLATALAPTFAVALLTRVIAGVGASIFSPTALGAAPSLVPPERRGYALSVVIAGLTAATALGSPIGAVIGGVGDWRWTMAFVAALAAGSLAGVLILLPAMPLPPVISLRQRIAPVLDPRIGLTLATTLIAMTGVFTVYTYFAVAFDRAIGGAPLVLGGLLVLWGAAGTLSNLAGGRLTDKIGNRKVILATLLLQIANTSVMPWTSATLWTAALAIFVWGAAGWGLLLPQQHRLVTLAPHIAPVVLGLNTTCTYLGVTAAGVIGALALPRIGGHYLGLIGTTMALLALAVSEIATRKIETASSSSVDRDLASA
jgi:MFS transporter, DHA1 family, inner membrane transport protein